MKETLEKEFEKYFNEAPSKYYFSPGRVNLIGEHIDYNGGKVLPMAISLGIYAAVKESSDDRIKVVSCGFNDRPIEFSIDQKEKKGDFTDYIIGVTRAIEESQGIKLDKGFSLYLESTLPPASGLSSSAALELLISHIIDDMYDLGLTDLEMVKLSQKAEREYVLVNCGIMDQFAIGMSRKDKAILLDTDTLDYSYIDFNLASCSLIIINTNKPRALVESKYNERRAECDEVLSVLKRIKPKDNLCSYELCELDKIKGEIGQTLYKRARHVISENKRVNDFTLALKDGDLVKAGIILNSSHASLKEDYEVSGLNLDVICSELKKNELVLGARMTGAGFGGCAIALFNTTDMKKIGEVMAKVDNVYKEKTNLNLSYYLAESHDKTGELNENN